MFGLEYTRVQVPVQFVGKERYVDVPHRKNRPGVVVIQQLKSMVKRSRGVGEGLIVHSRMPIDPAKVAPTMGEVEEYIEGNHPKKVKEYPVVPETLYIAFPVAKRWRFGCTWS